MFLHIQSYTKIGTNFPTNFIHTHTHNNVLWSLHRFTWLKIRTSNNEQGFFHSPPVLYIETGGSFSPATISIMECPSCSLRSSWLASRRTNERGTSLALLCHRLPERWSVKVEERSGKRPLPTESKKRGPGTLEPRNTHVLLSSRVDRTGPLYISSTSALLLRNRLYACTGMIIWNEKR